MPELSNDTNVHAQFARNKKSHSFLSSVIWGFLAFAVLLAALAGLARTDFITAFFPLRSVGSYHSQFELKWFDLQNYVTEHGGVDVVILGNSTVNTGIDPVIFQSRYRELSGKDLRVFNFGVEGLTIEPLSEIAKLIDATYHPGTIILFTEMRDYIASNGVEVSQQFLGNSWMRYQMADFSVQGFLIDHVTLLEYLLPFRNWSNPTFTDTYRLTLYRQGNLSPEGYEPEKYIGFGGHIPDPTNPEEIIKYKQAANYSIDPGRIRDLLDVISLQQNGTRVLITEIPLYPTYFVYFGSSAVREQYLAAIDSTVSNAGSTFIPSIDEELIPIYGRADDHHLNFQGVPIYSKLLADRFFAACELQSTCLISASEVNQP